MEVVTAFVPRDPDSCWKLFTDVALLGAWVPGLRRALVLTKERGLPAEVHFEFATSLAYTLVYSYDAASREVRWEPKLGKRDGVSGFARFVAEGDGTQITYGLEQGDARTPADRALGDPATLVTALQRWLAAADRARA